MRDALAATTLFCACVAVGFAVMGPLDDAAAALIDLYVGARR